VQPQREAIKEGMPREAEEGYSSAFPHPRRDALAVEGPLASSQTGQGALLAGERPRELWPTREQSVKRSTESDRIQGCQPALVILDSHDPSPAHGDDLIQVAVTSVFRITQLQPNKGLIARREELFQVRTRTHLPM
jgi:hypothetical protein